MDEENILVLNDNYMADLAIKSFASHRNIINLNSADVNKILYLPPTLVATVSNYLKDTEEEDPNCPVYQQLINS